MCKMLKLLVPKNKVARIFLMIALLEPLKCCVVPVYAGTIQEVIEMEGSEIQEESEIIEDGGINDNVSYTNLYMQDSLSINSLNDAIDILGKEQHITNEMLRDYIVSISENEVSANEIREEKHTNLCNKIDATCSEIEKLNVFGVDSETRRKEYEEKVISLLDNGDISNNDVVSTLNGSIKKLNDNVIESNNQLKTLNTYMSYFMAFMILIIVYLVCNLFYKFIIKIFINRMIN